MALVHNTVLARAEGLSELAGTHPLDRPHNEEVEILAAVLQARNAATVYLLYIMAIRLGDD